MGRQHSVMRRTLFGADIVFILYLLLPLCVINDAHCGPRIRNERRLKKMPYPKGILNLEGIPFKILFETYRKTDGKENWELYRMNADGSNPVNLTQAPDLNEMYPHASPDGTKISFVVDEGRGRTRVRSVYYMNIDGTDRVKIATNARQPCWNPDGKKIAYLRGEYERYSTREYATSELIIYDLESRQHKPHPCTTFTRFAGRPTASGFSVPYMAVWATAIPSWLSTPAE